MIFTVSGIYIAMIKLHDQNELGEERVHSIFELTVHD